MSKFKTKYKWKQRKIHFRQLDCMRNIQSSWGKILFFAPNGNSGKFRWYEEEHPFSNGVYWTVQPQKDVL